MINITYLKQQYIEHLNNLTFFKKKFPFLFNLLTSLVKIENIITYFQYIFILYYYIITKLCYFSVGTKLRTFFFFYFVLWLLAESLMLYILLK
jgi:hypothetical protein